MRPGLLRTSHEQRRRSSLALSSEQLSHLSKVAEAGKRRGSMCAPDTPPDNNGSPGAALLRRPSGPVPVLAPRRRSGCSDNKKKPLRRYDTRLELRQVNVLWIVLILTAVVVMVTGLSALLRQYL